MWLFLLILTITTSNELINGQNLPPEDNFNPFNNNNNNPSNYDPSFSYQNPLHQHDQHEKEATYFVVASRLCRPGQFYRVIVDIVQSAFPITVRASIHRDGVEITQSNRDVKEGIPEYLLLEMPPQSIDGKYKLRVEGMYNGLTGGLAFSNETNLIFSQRSMTIFIQMDKPIYMQSQIVRFRAIPINTELKPFNDPVDIFMINPQGKIMRRWLSQQSNLGTVSLKYQLSDQPVFGEWKIKIKARNQYQEKTFIVEEYYQTRFEVNVTMPAFFFDTDPYIWGVVQANFTSGAPVRGNLTLKATFTPLNPYQGMLQPVERYLNFNEYYPSWYNEPSYDYYNYPVLRFFNGTYRFEYPMSELKAFVPVDQGLEVKITATVGEHFLNEIIVGYSKTRISNSTVRINFIGGTPQVFKPSMMYPINLVASYHDGSPLKEYQLMNARVTVNGTVEMRNSGTRHINLETQVSWNNPAVWNVKIDLAEQLGLTNSSKNRRTSELNGVGLVKLVATYYENGRHLSEALLTLYPHESPNHKHMKVLTSTKEPKVGEYLVIHVQTNFYIDSFRFIIMSKGSIILTGQETMTSSVRTFPIPLSAEMAPVATLIVYHVERAGNVVADSLTIPVNGISRNNFTIFINNRKARTGNEVEVAIYGEPGAYVGLSAIDRAFYSMQAGNEITYAHVISEMAYFGEDTNKTHSHYWFYHNGDPVEIMNFPTSTYGIDVNRTFEYVGLVVFTDALIYRRASYCNISLGEGECFSRQCFDIRKKCDREWDCQDGTDEIGCDYNHNHTDLINFRKDRFNRIQRQYDNVWLWKDINIGPHGRQIFNIKVPRTPVHWMINAFGMSPNKGFGMLTKAIEYTGVLPFYINVEMPTKSRQGEQIGIRVSVFNYLTFNIEATVVLVGSDDYKFVHVETDGIVESYSPRTSFGDHQFFVFIPAQDATIVYLPIVPIRLGEIKIKVYAMSIIGRDTIERKLQVEADGLVQHRHQSILLDLSTRGYLAQYMHVNITAIPELKYVEDRYYVYGSNRAEISVVGDVVGPIFPTMPVNATSLIHLPMDSAENNMFSFAANVYTTMYMRLINQRNPIQEKHSFYYMNIAYQRQLSFLNEDGSFSLFRSDWNQSSPSVWLTAYCARVFIEASFSEWENYIYIDPNIVPNAIAWVLQHQTREGSFYEVTWLPDRKLNGTLYNTINNTLIYNISLTAHVLITLSNVKESTGILSSQVSLSITKAVKWIESQLYFLDQNGRPYEAAIVAYALLLAKSSSKDQAFNILSRMARRDGEFMYWGREYVPIPQTKVENTKPYSLPRLPYKYDAENIETTAYALLAHVVEQKDTIDGIVKWINAQRLTDGGWASTQDTAWAMKALMEYTVKSRIRKVSNLTVTVKPTALQGQKTFYVNNDNLAKLQSLKIPEAWGTVKVDATGAGYAILQMSVQYNIDLRKFQTQPPVNAFDLVVRPYFYGRNQSHITYLSCQRWIHTEESERSGMAILDVTIPTGYIIQQQYLDAYVRSRMVRNLQRARFLEHNVLFYFNYLDTEETCVNFTIERWYPVANMSRFLPIRVYDYYAPERFNETIFDSLSTYILNICEVCGSSQCPYCPIYNSAILFATPAIILLIFTSTLHFIFYFKY